MITTDKKFSLQTPASLVYMVRKPTTETENPPLLLLMHGVGSNEQDLFSLAQHLPDNFLIISAREANAYLKSLKITPTYKEFEGGHSITNEMLLSLIDWLKSE